jgi:hypothetical protein
MSLPAFSTQTALFATAALRPDFFAPTDRYRLFNEKIFPLLVQARPQLAQAWSSKGRAGVEPVWLAGVTLFQFLEGVPDRQAVEMLKYHAGWNFALNRTFGEECFHPTVLVYFRERLIRHEKSQVVFGQILEGLAQAGLMPRQNRQRLDSTHVVGLVSRMSRLECVRETLRLALQELVASSAGFGRPAAWPQWEERYLQTKLDYRLEAEPLKQKMNQAGLDALALLHWVEQLSSPKAKAGRQVQLLRRVFEENFACDPKGTVTQRPAQPTGAVHNPHDPEAQWAAKGQGKHRKEAVGYKIQVAETVQDTVLKPGEPTANFITAVVTQPATASDEAGLVEVEKKLAEVGLAKPSPWHVDGAYISGGILAQAKAEGREMIGPAQPAPKKEGRFSVEDFQIEIQKRQATCPAGKLNTQCSRLEEEATGKVAYRFEFSTHCHECPLRSQCLGAGQKHRTVVVTEHHDFLQARRQEQKTEQFQKEKRKRNAIEGTQSELVRGHGLRQARYRGQAKVQLQAYFTGAACNAKRWIRRILWEIKQASAGANVSFASG